MARRLQALWRSLDSSDAAPPPAPDLGYRGCVLDCRARGRWFAYGGVVASGDARKRDPGRRFERLILESAPEGVLPPGVLRELGSAGHPRHPRRDL